jgi:S-DNA-T family DNA segregation ATPase FtsK/SpoIIIE
MAQTKKTSSKTRSSSAKKSAKKTKAETEERARQRAARKALEEEEREKLRKKKLIHSEIISIVIIAIGVFFVLSMLTNACGMVGIAVANILKGILGKVSYVLPFFLIILGILVFAQKTALISWGSFAAAVFFFVFLSAAVSGFLPPLKEAVSFEITKEALKEAYYAGTESGGWLGVLVGAFLLNYIGRAGLYIICSIGIIIMLLCIMNTPLSQLLENWKLRAEVRKKEKDERYEARLAEKEAEIMKKEQEAQLTIETEPKVLLSEQGVLDNKVQKRKLTDNTLPSLNIESINDIGDESKIDERKLEIPEPEPIPREYEGEDITDNKRKILDYVADDHFFNAPVEEKKGFGIEEPVDILEKYGSKTVTPGTDDSVKLSEEIAEVSGDATAKKNGKYRFPPIDLLKKSNSQKGSGKLRDMTDQAKLLENTLLSFGVSATVLDVVKGPAVTRFEVQPAPGVQVSKIVHLQDDIALNLRAKSIRIEAPIPGKAAVGIEVSNDATQMVYLRELVECKEFKSHKSKIAVTLGKSISGENIVCDLHEMPHLLIAGTTGSGKSVCIDSMLVSLLYHAKPDEVKLMLIDPKIVELTPFNGIPHLMIPVVTEPGKAAVALGWAVTEMNERYNKFAEEGVKDLQSFNENMKFKGENERVMPEIVIVIDELADLIMAAKNQVEDSICRLAQKARAAGMHLVIATQRPSTDVITGVIKANIPSRIALSVSSQIDSRVILDMGGAENLLGKGDMLYSPQSLSKPIRIQGTYISDSELHAVIDFVKAEAAEGSYNEEIINAMDRVGSNNMGAQDSDNGDDLFMDALETVVNAESCSVSMLQRRFRIGYNRAARLVDMMEERGMVGPADGARPRKVLMTKEEFDEYVQRTAEIEAEIF